MQDKLGRTLVPGQTILAGGLHLDSPIEAEVLEASELIKNPNDPNSMKELVMNVRIVLPIPRQFNKVANVWIVKEPEPKEPGTPAAPPPGPRLISEK
jgi:hypothetical protein